MAIKEAIVIGGPNGAGKTTAAADLLPRTLGIPE
jgi:adenylate kinase family enzyme